MAREFARRFYKSKEWQQARMAALRRDHHLCIKCEEPAEEVHHITWLKPQNINDPSIAFNIDNLQSLCRDCHFAVHSSKMPATGINYRFNSNGELIYVGE